MSLRRQAAADLDAIIGNLSGFGWEVELVDPDGVRVCMTGLSADIGQTIDPQTGMVVIGRKATVALRLSEFDQQVLKMPRGVPDKTSKPWRVIFDDLAGKKHQFKVVSAMPDRTIGVITCELEAYER